MSFNGEEIQRFFPTLATLETTSKVVYFHMLLELTLDNVRDKQKES